MILGGDPAINGEKTPDVATTSAIPDDGDVVDDVPVDENLFTEDLDDLDAELEDLDI